MDIDKQLAKLEDQLLHGDFERQPQLIDQLLAKNFQEIGVNGAITTRADAIGWLLGQRASNRWQFINFTTFHISAEVVLVTYQAKRTAQSDPDYQGSMHSSLWVLNGEDWQMRFHQSTKIL